MLKPLSVAIALGVSAPSHAAETIRDPSELAGRFAACGAYLLQDARLARAMNRPDLERTAQDRARGWRLATAALLDDGAPGDAAFAAVLPKADALIQERLVDLDRRWRLGPERARDEARAGFERVCVPLVPLQERLVGLMTAPAASPGTEAL